MSFIAKTTKLNPPQFFVGYVNGDILGTLCTVISPMIFEAARIEDRSEADRLCTEDLGEDWFVSEIIEEGCSPNLA